MSARLAIPDLLLRYTLILVLGWRSIQVLLSPPPHVPRIIMLTLAGVELAGCVLFALPKLVVTGGWLLLASLLAAIVLHLLHGQYDVGGLVVYGAAVFSLVSRHQQSS